MSSSWTKINRLSLFSLLIFGRTGETQQNSISKKSFSISSFLIFRILCFNNNRKIQFYSLFSFRIVKQVARWLFFCSFAKRFSLTNKFVCRVRTISFENEAECIESENPSCSSAFEKRSFWFDSTSARWTSRANCSFNEIHSWSTDHHTRFERRIEGLDVSSGRRLVSLEIALDQFDSVVATAPSRRSHRIYTRRSRKVSQSMFSIFETPLSLLRPKQNKKRKKSPVKGWQVALCALLALLLIGGIIGAVIYALTRPTTTKSSGRFAFLIYWISTLLHF